MNMKKTTALLISLTLASAALLSLTSCSEEEKEIADRVEALIREGVAELVQLEEESNG